ncbi:glycosyltransferase [uncultured Roseivirga sp.]|uniref:glycosyltransferase n=1 Tax=uncultured Roseivirga sp. TaxID=543088 RepID=UPI000D799773|nr:glycosyltransferase [uncultured Roseivirga sp.]PWL31616.1 MAG: teichuronic acid biosynthesis glycosyltransferase tuaH [Roseivirga sp. XM-24bin3]
MKKVIVCHSFPAWDTPYIKSTIELLKQLSKDHRVIMIDYHYTIKDLFFNKFAPVKNILGTGSRIRNQITDHGEIELISTPPVLPINWIKSAKLYDWAAKLNSRIVGRSIKSQLKKLGVEEYTLINAFNPIFGYHTRNFFSPKKSIYYCYDEISGTDWSGKHGTHYEEIYMPLVDEVICTSTTLQSNKLPLAKQVKFIPNGVNLDIFLAPHNEKSKGNTIGYVGAVDKRIDFELISYCAENLPEYNFEFYGPVKTELPPLPSNVSLMGSVEQHMLPDKMQNFDVGLIPFVKSKLTAAIYPLKINEYLAMGKPVVASNFSDLSDFSKVAEIADSQEEFLKAIKRSIRYNSRIKTQKRVEFAKQNSWANRAREFAEAI